MTVWKAFFLCTALAAASLQFSGCAAKRQASAWNAAEMAERGPGPIRATSDAQTSFFSEQRVTIDWGPRAMQFRAVMQQRGALLELILLDPMGRPAFRLHQQGEEIGVEEFSEHRLPFPPEYMMADVQKAFMAWETVAGECRVAEANAVASGLCMRQIEREERLDERRFWREDLAGHEPVVIRYRYLDGTDVLRHVELVSPWFSYNLQIEILRWEAL